MVMVAGCVAPAAPAPDMADTEMMEVVSTGAVTLTDDAAPLDKQVYRFSAIEGKHFDTMRNEYEGFAYESTIEQLAKMGPEGNWHPAAADSWEQVEVPFARDGMYYKEFPVMFDWMHNGEGFSVFFLQPLSDPDNLEMRRRMERFAGFYMGTDPQADNDDAAHRVIRSMFNGSRGPLMRKSTGLDWAGDSIEVEGRFKPGHGERNYAEMVAHFEDYNDVVGDHPLNLSTTTLAFNAFMLSGDAAYKDWLVNDVDAWCERTAANDGIIPTNIGLDGSLGGACDGKWYGGVYGWGFSVTVPQTGALAHRPYFVYRAHYGFGNGLLMTGDQGYVDTWRGVIENVNANAKVSGGQTLYPHMHGDDGWYDYTPQPFSAGAMEVYYWSMDRADLRFSLGSINVKGARHVQPNQAECPDLSLRSVAHRSAVLLCRDPGAHPPHRRPGRRFLSLRAGLHALGNLFAGARKPFDGAIPAWPPHVQQFDAPLLLLPTPSP